jgi:hypothetical protein
MSGESNGMLALLSGGVLSMPNILIRGLSEAAVAHIDADAAAHGLSRNEHLRRRFEAERSPGTAGRPLTIDDLRRAATAARDLDNPQVVQAAWQ